MAWNCGFGYLGVWFLRYTCLGKPKGGQLWVPLGDKPSSTPAPPPNRRAQVRRIVDRGGRTELWTKSKSVGYGLFQRHTQPRSWYPLRRYLDPFLTPRSHPQEVPRDPWPADKQVEIRPPNTKLGFSLVPLPKLMGFSPVPGQPAQGWRSFGSVGLEHFCWEGNTASRVCFSGHECMYLFFSVFWFQWVRGTHDSVVQWLQFFFHLPFLVAGPLKWSRPQKELVPFFSRVTEER